MATANFNLPLIDGNATADVPRDMNALAEAIDANVKAAIDDVNITVPDASLTQKGIVQLSNATNSTSTTLAATPSAVKTAYDLAASKADSSALTAHTSNSTVHITAGERTAWNAKRDENSNLLPNSSGALGFTAWSIFGGVDGWAATRVGDSFPGYFAYGAASGASAKYIESDPIPMPQGSKFVVSADFFTLNAAGEDTYIQAVGSDSTSDVHLGYLFGLDNNGWHRRSAVITQASGKSMVKIRFAIQPGKSALFRAVARIGVFGGVTARTWNCDSDSVALFQLSNDLKTKVANAVIGKGGSASASMSGDQLAAAITALAPREIYIDQSYSARAGDTGNYNDWHVLTSFPAGLSKIVFTAPDIASCQVGVTPNSTTNTTVNLVARICLTDEAGNSVDVCTYALNGTLTPGFKQRSNLSFIYSAASRTVRTVEDTGGRTLTLPTAFNTAGVVRVQSNFNWNGITGQVGMSARLVGTFNYM